MKRRRQRMTPREAGISVLMVLVIVWLGFLIVGIYHKEQVARTTVKETKAELATLEARRKTLAASVQEMQTDRGKEGSLRETYGVAKPGEDVIIVVPKKELPPPPEPTFWDRVKGFFGF
jgi:cell division protein FtsB